MSHFTVMVIGGNVEAQLAPFHEFECTGFNDQFVVEVDETAELQEKLDELLNPVPEDGASNLTAVAKTYEAALAEALSYFGYEGRVVNDESEIDTGTLDTEDDAPHKWGYVLLKDGKLVKSVRRTNPNRKWDWWVMGGRWSGMLRLKGDVVEALKHYDALTTKGLPIPDSLLAKIDGIKMGERSWINAGVKRDLQYVDQAPRGAIDVDGMREEAGKGAGEQWDKAHQIIAGRQFDTWDKCRQAFPENIEKARDVYHAQEVIKDVNKNREVFGIFGNLEPFLVPRERFVQTARDGAFATYAVLKGGEWFEKGRMGWWGMASDEKEQDSWNAEFAKLVEGLPDDTLITIVDCHI